jgi:hypothetical protein
MPENTVYCGVIAKTAVFFGRGPGGLESLSSVVCHLSTLMVNVDGTLTER